MNSGCLIHRRIDCPECHAERSSVNAARTELYTRHALEYAAPPKEITERLHAMCQELGEIGFASALSDYLLEWAGERKINAQPLRYASAMLANFSRNENVYWYITPEGDAKPFLSNDPATSARG